MSVRLTVVYPAKDSNVYSGNYEQLRAATDSYGQLRAATGSYGQLQANVCCVLIRERVYQHLKRTSDANPRLHCDWHTG